MLQKYPHDIYSPLAFQNNMLQIITMMSNADYSLILNYLRFIFSVNSTKLVYATIIEEKIILCLKESFTNSKAQCL